MPSPLQAFFDYFSYFVQLRPQGTGPQIRRPQVSALPNGLVLSLLLPRQDLVLLVLLPFPLLLGHPYHLSVHMEFFAFS